MERQAWEKMADEEMNTPVGPEHYQNVRHNGTYTQALYTMVLADWLTMIRVTDALVGLW